MPVPIVPDVPRVRYRYLRVEMLDPNRGLFLRRLRLVCTLIGVVAVAVVLFTVACALFGLPAVRK